MSKVLRPPVSGRSRLAGVMGGFRRNVLASLICGLLMMSVVEVRAGELRVAVATNFAPVLEAIEPIFEGQTGDDLILVSASTGKLYAQVLHGAPFDVLLAADQERPARLVAEGWGDGESLRTYAVGRLVLWSADPGRVAADGGETLRKGEFRRLALANPELAPYGLAAAETLAALGLENELKDRLVRGENIGQTFGLVATGNAEMGFVAASQLGALDDRSRGSLWFVPESLHAPIRQDAVMLERGSNNPAAARFLDFLMSESVRTLIRRSGYAVE